MIDILCVYKYRTKTFFNSYKAIKEERAGKTMNDIYKFVKTETGNSPLGKHLGWSCKEVSENRAVLVMPFAAHNVTVGEMVHGGAIAALADACATAACWASTTLPENPRGSTIGFSMNYLAAALGTALEATGEVVRRGGSICVADVWIKNEKGEDVAKATFTYKLSGK